MSNANTALDLLNLKMTLCMHCVFPIFVTIMQMQNCELLIYALEIASPEFYCKHSGTEVQIIPIN